MSILLKMNSRIKLISCDKNVFIFSIDENRTAKFYTQTKNLHPVLLDFVCQGISLEKLENQDSSLSRFFLFINELKKNGLIDYHFHFNDHASAIVHPRSPQFNDSVLMKSINFTLNSSPHIFSRFSYFRREGKEIALECPLTPFKTVFTQSAFNYLLFYLTENKDLAIDKPIFLQKKTLQIFLNLLIEYDAVHSVDKQEIEYLNFWEFHDLLFHLRSRRGSFDDNISFGATYRFQKKINSPLIFRKDCEERVIELYKPDLNQLMTQDAPFSKIMENRRSNRNFNENQMLNVEEVGEFLYRSIAIREIIKTPSQDAIFRPYPGAGAIHEIEFYLIINNCNGLESGVYYYEPVKHMLYRKSVEKQYIEKINVNTRSGMGISVNPQIIFILTSRFRKIAWKYEKMAYRCTLISMGAIFQTMSLVATSMKLASCIIGSGDSSLFAEALKMNALEEGAIGEFALGVPVR